MTIPTTVTAPTADVRKGPLHLVVVGPEVFINRPLPPGSCVTIGRAETADVRLADPMASRLHAQLHVDAEGNLAIEDLGSINKTFIRQTALPTGSRVGLTPGETVTIGSTVLMVQVSRETARLRRIWPHPYFEARLEEECARAHDTKAPFAILRINIEGDLSAAQLIEQLSPSLRLPDMVAVYGPGQYEILLPNTVPDMASALARDLVARLTQARLQTRVGIAFYPRDGLSPETLLGTACERVRDLPVNPGGPGIVVQDPRMRRLHQLAEQVAAGTINVLVTGETGVGKEILAEAIHKHSPRSKEKYVCINCAAFAETLLESELFGHEKGAFTGATEAKAGLLETAPGGTIFLDEIGEIPLPTQAKLLRVIETRKLTRVGSLKERAIDVRFVAATNRDLAAESEAGRFRKDLYYRLNGITLSIPPLRERRAEIEPLTRTFVEEICARMKRSQVPVILNTALELLLNYSWPGNIRELRNIMERAVLLAHDEIGLDQLPVETMLTNLRSESVLPEMSMPVRPTPQQTPTVPGTPGTSESERDRILRVLDECGGNQSRAARRLGIARSTLVIKLDSYRVPRPRKTFE